jgi:hypothetical protein
MAQSDENGFVKRGFFLLAGMLLLVGVVLGIIFIRPEQPLPEVVDLPPRPSEAGWKIRYNATVAFLRRGSDRVPWRNVREMLDEKLQLKNSEFVRPDGRTLPDESQARSFVITALKALGEWRRKMAEAGKRIDDIAELRDIRAQVDVLAKSKILQLKKHAEETRLALEK